MDFVSIALKWALAGFLCWWFPLHFSVWLRALWTFQTIDIVSGILSALARGIPLRSDVSIRGISKKVLVNLVVFVSHSLEVPFGHEYGLENVTAAAYAFNEVVSILENVERAGVKISPALIQYAKRLVRDVPGAGLLEKPDPESERLTK